MSFKMLTYQKIWARKGHLTPIIMTTKQVQVTCRYKEGRLHWSYMGHISKCIGRKLGQICTMCTCSPSSPCALHGCNLHFFISCAYFVQSSDKDDWPL